MEEFGIGLHCHHNLLYEVVEGYSERLAYFETQKPPGERPTRRRLFAMIPDEMLPASLRALVIQARVAWTNRKALTADYEANLKALAADYEAKLKALDADYWTKRKPLDADYEAKYVRLTADYQVKLKPLDADYEAKYVRLTADLDVAVRAVYADLALFGPEMKAVHARLCPNCPWDGQRIVFPGERE